MLAAAAAAGVGMAMPRMSVANVPNDWAICASTRLTQLSLPLQPDTRESNVATVLLSLAYALSTDSAASALVTVLLCDTATPMPTA